MIYIYDDIHPSDYIAELDPLVFVTLGTRGRSKRRRDNKTRKAEVPEKERNWYTVGDYLRQWDTTKKGKDLCEKYKR